MIIGKVWGTTRTLLRTANVEIHALEIKAGASCSWHKHTHKFNAFIVHAGRLTIEVEKADYPLVDATSLGAGEITTVKPGEFHRFVAKTRVHALEVYYLGDLSEDILRRDVGSATARPRARRRR